MNHSYKIPATTREEMKKNALKVISELKEFVFNAIDQDKEVLVDVYPHYGQLDIYVEGEQSPIDSRPIEVGRTIAFQIGECPEINKSK